MPGIVGFITARRCSNARSQLLRMLDPICHETFYRSGTFVDEMLGVYIGWTALSGSFSDGMPLRNEDENICMIFSGEEYSDRLVRNELRARGHSLGPTEAEYLVHMHEEDSNFIENLNGMFHGLVADRARGTVSLFNDRFGMHRLYYHESSDGFYFASEAKAILAVRPELRTIDPRSLGEFAALSCVLENRTIFKNIYLLPGASAWTFRNGRLDQKTTYFEPHRWEEQTPLATESYYQELRSVVSTALPRYFSGRQPMGIAMTGGLDTRVILACHPPTPQSLPSYTFGSKYRDSYDVRIGRQIASVCRQSHRVIEVGDEFLASFPHYAERSVYITEGTVDVYRASDLYVSEKVREIAPAKIVGTYGSEILRHSVMFKPAAMRGLFCPDFLPYLRDAEATYSTLRQQHPVTFAAFRQSPWYHHGILALEQSQLTVRSPFMDNNFVRTVYREPKESVANGDVRLRLIQDGDPALGRIPSDRGVGGNGGRLNSVLARATQEFTFKAEYAYDYGMPQSVARIDHLFSGFRPERLFLGRHKLLHFRVWYRDILSAYVREMLLDPRTLSRPYLERKSVEAVVNGHINRGLNHTTEIHKLLTLELIQRLFLDGQ